MSLLSLLARSACAACDALPTEHRPQGQLELLLLLQRRVQQQQQQQEDETEDADMETGSGDAVKALKAAGAISVHLRSLVSLSVFFLGWLLTKALKQLEQIEKIPTVNPKP